MRRLSGLFSASDYYHFRETGNNRVRETHLWRHLLLISPNFPTWGEAFASKLWPFGRCGGVRPLFGLNPFGFLGIWEREIFTFLSHSMFEVKNKCYFSII
jgi:hypothetical protein